MANNKRYKGMATTGKHRSGIFFVVLAFAATASFAATTSVTALSGESGLNTGADSSASVDGSVSTENSDTNAGADADAETTSESDVSLSNSGAELSNSVETDTGADVSTSVSESEDSENDTGSETDAEASGEGEASVSSNVTAPGKDTGSEVGFGMDLLLRSNILAMTSEPVELEEGDVEVQTASEGDANFESNFEYYKVDHGVDYDKAIYREPARLGGDNVELSGDASGSFLFGVSGPNDEGIQSEVNHQGKTMLYLNTDDGWKSLEAQFNGEGELQHVNGVSPEVVQEEETEEVVE